jgi:hypothetical protein
MARTVGRLTRRRAHLRTCRDSGLDRWVDIRLSTRMRMILSVGVPPPIPHGEALGRYPHGRAVIDASGVDQRRSHMNPWCPVTKIQMPGRAGESASDFPTPESRRTPTGRYAGGLPVGVAGRPRRRVARSAASSPSSPGPSGFGWRGFVPPGPVFVPVEWTTATVRASLPCCAASWPARGVGERDRQPMDLTRKDLRVA